MGLKELGLFEMEEVSQEQEDTTSEFEYQDLLFGTEEEDNKKEKTSINNILKAKITNYTNGNPVDKNSDGSIAGLSWYQVDVKEYNDNLENSKIEMFCYVHQQEELQKG